ncbi:MAG TPA: response regulator transcription factor [Chitinophagaceae bacterium]|nr:response regulator transcription factor [Chitinophagaceae bacterium]
MKKNIIKIGIVDGHNLFRKALKNLLCMVDDFEVVIESTHDNDLIDKLYYHKDVDVVLLDLCMPGLSGKETLNLLFNKHPHVKVIVLSMHMELKTVSELLNFGIYGCIPKEAELAELIDAIRSASEGALYKNKILTDALYWRTSNTLKGPFSRNGHYINEKHKKILQLLWQEKTTQEIADEVFLSVSAVDKIKQQLKEKTGAKTTVGLIKYGIEKSIIAI